MRRIFFGILAFTFMSSCSTTKTYQYETITKEEFGYDYKFVSVDSIRIRYADIGKGTPIILIHGNPSSSFLWRNVIPHLKGYRLIVPDLPGMGQSDKVNMETSKLLNFQINMFEKFVNKLDLKNAIYVGHDWGGLLALNQSTKSNAKALVLMEFALQDMSEQIGFWGTLIWDTWLVKAFRYNGFVEDGSAIEWLQRLSHRKLTQKEMDTYRSYYKNPSERKITYDWWANLCADGKPASSCKTVNKVFENAKKTKIPKLLLWANQGLLIGSEKKAIEIKDEFINMEIRNVGDGTHYIQEDQPAKIGREIKSWLKSNI